LTVCPQCARSFPADQLFCTSDGSRLGTTSDPALGATEPSIGPAPSRAPPSPSPSPSIDGGLAPGSTVGEYVVESQIGQGGMGVIYRGVHPIIGKHAAIKVLSAPLAANEDMVARFIQEAKSVNRIRHRHIVDIFGFGVLDDGRHYFAMELLEGEPLSARLARGPLPLGELLDLMLEGASALEAAHKTGIVHRDLKPDNLFLCSSPDGNYLKVLDFGIAKLMGDSAAELAKTVVGVPIGTPLYMSPEQAAGEPHVDYRSDLYSLGVVLYECLAGHPPFRGQTLVQVLNSHLTDPPPPLQTRIHIPPALEALVVQLLAKGPADRPADMAEVRQRLRTLRDQLGRLPDRALGRPRGRRRVAAIAVGVLAAAGGGAFWRATRPKAPMAPASRAPTVVVAAPAPLPSPPPPPAGSVRVSTNVLATRLYLDAKSTDGTIAHSAEPAAAGGANLKVTVPAGAPYLLRVEADGYEPVTLPLKVSAGEELALPVLLVRASGGEDKHVRAAPAARPRPAVAPAPPPKRRVNENLMEPF
jgi:tRNA A-37 threonylcarbamoyl transferase component Bud32